MTRPKVPFDKRQRTAQACDTCKRRKQKVSSHFLPLTPQHHRSPVDCLAFLAFRSDRLCPDDRISHITLDVTALDGVLMPATSLDNPSPMLPSPSWQVASSTRISHAKIPSVHSMSRSPGLVPGIVLCQTVLGSDVASPLPPFRHSESTSHLKVPVVAP
ncbi:hypothetical protein CCHL11_03453 [Colletotrichum chlorophyti]|uniref:Uncharacterized protein n=1 Tax=Colletotrichum chlorophyti TaxID=708187 RepID=A0A1Q8S0C5_9PEZI|nr:hypothetical protein CCHL11_03453 [Colletotrichum chlorophyti]